jgi:hypothetical protein
MDLIKGPGGGSSEGVPILLGPTVLEPGASIGAQLASGDLDITAVGTLTWVADDGRFLAFGHPFLADGPTDMPFVTTSIVYTMPALDRSYKMGEPLEVVGTVTQDRTAMIAGYLRQIPEMVDFHLEVIDRDLDRTRRFNYSVINKEDWLPILGWLMPTEGIVYAMDRMGRGTCKVSFTIRGEGLAEPIRRDNLVYATYDVSYEALNEFMEALSIPTSNNPYRDVRLTSVDISIEVTSERQTLDITKARFNNAPNMGPGAIGYTGPTDTEEENGESRNMIEEPTLPEEQGAAQEVPFEEEMAAYMQEMMMNAYDMSTVQPTLVGYHPGDTVEILVTLRPWREKPVERVIELEIPKDFPVGQTTIDIMGGASNYYGYYGATDAGYYTDSGMYLPPEDLDEMIENFVTRDVNNSIIIRLNQILTGQEDPYYYLQDKVEQAEPVKTTLILDDIIYGWFSLPIEILSNEEEGAEEAMPADQAVMDYLSGMMQQEAQPGGSSNPHRH